MSFWQRLRRILLGEPSPPAPVDPAGVEPAPPLTVDPTALAPGPAVAAPPSAPESVSVVFSYPDFTAPAGTPSPLAPEPTARPLATPTAPEASADPYFTAGADPVTNAPPKGPAKAADPLDAGDYLPITREEIKEEAKGKNLFNNFAFGLRSVIPPADDLRTKLIDRAMVTHGLLSPEQLREIHAVGARMDALKPSMAAVERKAAKAGEAAVEADREARARLKAQKKAEAAERRRLRAEGIAHRKATDITFLGRGVSARLGDRTGDAAKLEAAGLPVLSTPAELAAALGLSISRLRWLAFQNEAATRVHYVQFAVPKNSGGTRTLSAPHRSLAEAQGWIFREILAGLPVEPPAHGFVAGRSILSNASPHCRKRLVVNMDLEGFFPSIGFRRVRSVFQRLGYSPAVATILGLLCTECPRRTVVYDGVTYHVATGPRGLPQGACTSPALSNQVARRLDRRLGGLAARLDLSYSRYADDLTFSGDEAFEGRVGYLMARVRHIAGAEGFAVNEAKTRVLRQGTAQTVTGLVVNDRPGVRRCEVRRLRAILHRARAEGLEAQNREGRPDFLAWLRGKIAFVAMARPEAGASLKAELEALLTR